MSEPVNEFQPDMTSKPAFTLEAFDGWVDPVEAEAAVGIKPPMPSESLGLALTGILTSKESQSGRVIVLEYEDDLTVAAMDLESEAAAAEFVEEQCGPEAGDMVSRPDVGGHRALAWGAIDTPLEVAQDGDLVDGSGVVTTASQVMWADGTLVVWVTHPTRDADELLTVARSIY